MNETRKKALSLLKSYSGIEERIIKSNTEKQELQESLKQIIAMADDQNFGICASNANQAFNALKNYLQAFSYPYDLNREETVNDQPVYLKFSTQRQSYHLSDYSGNYRGVLITIFSDLHDEIIGTYGHFPLDLFI